MKVIQTEKVIVKDPFDVDVAPNCDFAFTTYIHVQGNEYKKYDEYQTKEEAAIIFSDKTLLSNKCLIYITEEDELMFFNRQMH